MLLLPVTLTVKRRSCIHRTFPLSLAWERQSNATGKGCLTSRPPKLCIPTHFQPFPQAEGSSSAAGGVRLTPWGDLRGRQRLCRGGLGSLPLTSRPSPGSASRTLALPPLPPRSAGCQPPPPFGEGGTEVAPGWGQPERAKPRGPEPLPGLCQRCGAPELCPLLGVEPPGMCFPRICPCRITKWSWAEPPVVGGVAPALHMPAPPFPRKSTFFPLFYCPSSSFSDTSPVAGGGLKGGCDRLAVPAAHSIAEG